MIDETKVMSRLASLAAVIALAACAGGPTAPVPTWRGVEPGWTAAMAESRAVGLGLSGGAVLAQGVSFAGGLEVIAAPNSPLHGLSDLKLTGENGFIAVSDSGELAHGELRLDQSGRLVGVERLRTRRLTDLAGTPIAAKEDGDAEGLAITDAGDLLISFERDHRIWNYGGLSHPLRPFAVPSPVIAAAPNDGMEALAASGAGWRVAGESGGVWDCNGLSCSVVQPPPARPLTDRDYRTTGMDRDPSRANGGDGWFVVQRRFTPPFDARAQVRRMAPDGRLAPVLVELKLPGTTDNFEGIAAERRGDQTRLYILSDDNGNPLQRTLLLAFDVGDRSILPRRQRGS